MPAALLVILALQAAVPAAPGEQMDFVCTATDTAGGAPQQLRYSVDLHSHAWCAREPACTEIKTVFGVKGSKLVLESSSLEVTSYETSIDRADGAYNSVVSLGGMRTETKGVCKPAPFTPFGVAVSGTALKP